MARSIKVSWWPPVVAALASIALAMATPRSADAQIPLLPSPCASAGCPIRGVWWIADGTTLTDDIATITDGTWTCQTTDGWQTWSCTDNSGSIVSNRPAHQRIQS
jgi:hypothetical protein